MGSNYEKQVYLAREIFLKYDQEGLVRKFELQQDENYLYIEMLGTEYRIARVTGEIEERAKLCAGADIAGSDTAGLDKTVSDDAVSGQDTRKSYVTCLDYQVVMTIYDILCYSRETPCLSGDWCPLQSLQVTMSSPSPEKLNKAVSQAFSNHVPELKQACLALGGEHQAVPASADACYKISIFPFFPVIFQFWDGDEEFDPKVMILWDRKSLDFMHFETLYYAMNQLLDTLRRMVTELVQG